MGIFDKFKSLFKKKDEKKDDSLLEKELKEKIKLEPEPEPEPCLLYTSPSPRDRG